MKQCINCNQIKELADFPVRPDSPDGHRNECKECKKKWHHNYNKNRYPVVKERILEKGKEWYGNNSEKRKEYRRKWYTKNSGYNKQYYIDHSEEIKNHVYACRLERFKIDPVFKIRERLRTRLYNIIKCGNCSGSFSADFGCSLEEFKKHIELMFYANQYTGENMSWENYGFYGWHADHIMPLSSFNLSDRAQFLKACHYTNIQPLWAKDNLFKSNKILSKEEISNLKNNSNIAKVQDADQGLIALIK